MPTSLHDIPARMRFVAGLAPATLTSGTAGPSIDCLESDGPILAVLAGTGADEDATIGLAVSESADGQTWAEIPGAELPAAEADGEPRSLKFARNQRYIRGEVTLTGTDPSVIASLIFGLPRKLS